MQAKSKPIIAIPDIHGYLRDLVKLLEALEAEDYLMTHRLVLLGDLIDRGPDSHGVIELACNLKRQGHIIIVGNHDFSLIQALFSTDMATEWMEFWRNGYESGVLGSYGLPNNLHDHQVRLALRQAMPVDHQEFLISLPWFFEDNGHVCVHAGLVQFQTWQTQREALHFQHLPASFQPSQLFSRSLARTMQHPAVGKQLITGHSARRLPLLTPSRVMLDCGVDRGGFLAAYVSDEARCVRANYGHLEEVSTCSTSIQGLPLEFQG